MIIQKRKLYLPFAIASLIIGSILLLLSEASLTGAVIGLQDSAGSLFGTILILASAILFLMVHFEREKHDAYVNSFRRWLEKERHKKVSYDSALKQFENVEQKYWKAVGGGKIKQHYKERPLKFIEDYIELSAKERQEKLYKQPERAEGEGRNEAAELLKSRRVVDKYDELTRVARRMGYELKPEKDHYNVYGAMGGKMVRLPKAAIPKHTPVKRETSKKILKQLRENFDKLDKNE